MNISPQRVKIQDNYITDIRCYHSEIENDTHAQFPPNLHVREKHKKIKTSSLLLMKIYFFKIQKILIQY